MFRNILHEPKQIPVNAPRKNGQKITPMNTLSDTLVQLEQTPSSGILEVSGAESLSLGKIELSSGVISNAQKENLNNHWAIFSMLEWENPQINWVSEAPLSVKTCLMKPSLIIREHKTISDYIANQWHMDDYIRTILLEHEARLNKPYPLATYDGVTYILELTDVPNHPRYDISPGSHILGQNAPADIQIPYQSISRSHCKITYEKDIIRVADTASTNGTYVNDFLIDKDYLFPGDILRLGEVRLSLKAVFPKSKPKKFRTTTSLLRFKQLKETPIAPSEPIKWQEPSEQNTMKLSSGFLSAIFKKRAEQQSEK